MDMSIILCTYNRCRNLEHALESICRMEVNHGIAWELIVVDNNSSDQTRQVVKQVMASGRADIRYLFEGRQGKSYALNSGIQAARGAVLAFTDDDVTVDAQWLNGLKRTFAEYDCCGVGGRIIPVFTATAPPWLKLDVPKPFMNALVAFDFGAAPCPLGHTPFGANMAFRREVFIRYGMFRTDLGPVDGNLMGKGEDSEFAARVSAAGETLMYAPDAVIYHPVEAERMRKRYFESWYYNFGRARVRRNPTCCDGMPRLWGAPRYLYRELLTRMVKWAAATNGHRRFCTKLELLQTAGELIESISGSMRHENDALQTIRCEGAGDGL